jgi:glycosyltransferase involved in cell wall biosynthesis
MLLDGEALVVDHFSGIGHYTADLFLALDKLITVDSGTYFEICAPYRRISKLGRFGFKNAKFRKMPFPTRVSNALKIRGQQPPIDIIFGKKLYIYPNYSSWPALFSKSVSFIYDLSFIKYAQFVEPRNQKFLVEQVQKSVARSSKIVTISQNSKDEIIEEYGVRAEDVIICYPAIDNRKFYKRAKEEIKNVKAKYGIFGDYILFVGNIEPRKNLAGLIEAYCLLDRDVREQYSLLLIGAKGWLDSDINDLILKARMDGNRVVQPSDYVEDNDLPAIYSGAAAMAYVSLYEGFGIPPLEAMACGTPVVSSDNSSLPEAVGNAAVMVDALNPEEIAKGLHKVLKDENVAEDLRRRGFDQVDKFSYQKSAQTLLDTLREIS